MELDLLELRKAFLQVLVELRLHLLGNGKQLGVDTLAYGLQTFGGLLVELRELGLERRSGQAEGIGQFRPGLAQLLTLLPASRCYLILHSLPDFGKPIR